MKKTIDIFVKKRYNVKGSTYIYAEIAQLVEHFTRNEGVVGSSPIFGCRKIPQVLMNLRYF